MTQREWERLHGRCAAIAWAVSIALFAGALMLSTPTVQSSPAKTMARHAAARQQGVAEQQGDATGGALGFLAGFVTLSAFSFTSLWRWRRRQRIRAEIRAEAFARRTAIGRS